MYIFTVNLFRQHFPQECSLVSATDLVRKRSFYIKLKNPKNKMPIISNCTWIFKKHHMTVNILRKLEKTGVLEEGMQHV